MIRKASFCVGGFRRHFCDDSSLNGCGALSSAKADAASWFCHILMMKLLFGYINECSWKTARSPSLMGQNIGAKKMTGKYFKSGARVPFGIALVATLGLAACEEGGGGVFGPNGRDASTNAAPSGPARLVQSDRDVERPDIFVVTDRGLWDGRPSLGGVWVAHPDVQDPQRVIIRNTETGASIVGALFRRERENPGPLLQVSSDAATELGLLAGAPTELSVIALLREEVEVPQAAEEGAENPEENAVLASLAAPVTIAATALDDVAAAVDTPAIDTVAIDPIVGAAAAIAAVEAAEATGEIAAVAALPAAVGNATAPLAQIGVFSVEANANNAAQAIRDAGIPSSVETQDAGGRTVWRVVAGPVSDDATLAQLKSIGFVDAFIVDAQ
jgi:cell division septation protein DedD